MNHPKTKGIVTFYSQDNMNEVKEFDIISICDTIRIAMFDEPYPYIVPVNFGEEIIGD